MVESASKPVPLNSEQVEAMRRILKRYLEGSSLTFIAREVLGIRQDGGKRTQSEQMRLDRCVANLRNFLRSEGTRRPQWDSTLGPLYEYADKTLRSMPIDDEYIKKQLRILLGPDYQKLNADVVARAMQTLFNVDDNALSSVSQQYAGFYRCYRFGGEQHRFVKALLEIKPFDEESALSKFTYHYRRGHQSRQSKGVSFRIRSLLYLVGGIGLGGGVKVIVLQEPMNQDPSPIMMGGMLTINHLKQPLAARVICVPDPNIFDPNDVDFDVKSVTDLRPEVAAYLNTHADPFDNYALPEAALNLLAPPPRSAE